MAFEEATYKYVNKAKKFPDFWLEDQKEEPQQIKNLLMQSQTGKSSGKQPKKLFINFWAHSPVSDTWIKH